MRADQARRELKARMAVFSVLYNRGYHVRDSFHGTRERQREAVEQFIAVLLAQLGSTQDREACLYAACDALTLGPLGTPWGDT